MSVSRHVFAVGEVLTAANVESYLNNGAYARITTPVTVVNTVTDTNLVNETIPGGAISTSKEIVLRCSGDWKQGSGGPTASPRMKVKLGSGPTVVLDTGAAANVTGADANRRPWRAEVRVRALGAANSLWASLTGRFIQTYNAGGITAFATGEGKIWVPTASGGDSVEFDGVNSSSIDMASDQALILSVVLPTADVNCDIVLKYASLHVL